MSTENVMADQSKTLKQVREIWSQVRAFAMIWLAFTSLGGFLILVGGPWAIGLLTGILGAKAAFPGWVITILMIATLPAAIYFFIQQKRLDASLVFCEECGERYAIQNASCPMCGAARTNGETAGEKEEAAKT